jgi:SRSO17 transposase
VSKTRSATETVAFVDDYCAAYRDLFSDVRSFEYFKLLHVGLISDLKRKSLPALAKAVGLDNSQGLHRFVTDGDWDLAKLRQQRLTLTKQALAGRTFTLCIDETGDRKKGTTTDYVAHQYIGNLGKIDNGIVSVNAYGVLDTITFPLTFEVFKPQKRLHDDDTYQTKPSIAISLVKDLIAQGFQIDLVLADSLYGESHDLITALNELKLSFIVAIRSNHGVWMQVGQRIRVTRWRPFTRHFSNGNTQKRWIREVIYGRRHALRYYQMTTDPDTMPRESTQFVMTNLTGDIRETLGDNYGIRTWIEYGFKQVKDELGWADYRVTHYEQIERWWEIVCSVYVMVSFLTRTFQREHPVSETATTFSEHPWWSHGAGWKHMLNNLRLVAQPFVYCSLLLPWLSVVPVPGLYDGFRTLIAAMNSFRYHFPQ